MSEPIKAFLPQPDELKPKLKVVTAAEFMLMDIPPREEILAPVFLTQSLNMIHAYRGVGKTHIAMGLAYAVASGGPFLKWTAQKARRVVYIDGEMPASALQERLAAIATVAEETLPADDYLRLITPDLQPRGMPDLSTEEGQWLVDQYIEDAELIIMDNLSSLCRTGRENDAEGWTSVQSWALQHRSAGRSICFIHHDGKGGGQRGTSKKEDLLDTVIGLKRPSDYEEEQGARFEVHYNKARHLYGTDAKAFEAWLKTDESGGSVWAFQDVADATSDRVIALFKEGLKQTEIANELDINKSTVCRAIKKAKADGRLTK